MSIQILPQSHVDHGLTEEQLHWVLGEVADRTAFFIATLTLPEHLGTVECNLVGPAVGQPPVVEDEVTYVIRGSRKCASRVLRRLTAKPLTRMVTVIAGASEGHEGLVLYTAYGGPCAPREPGDTSIPNWEAVQESREFWSQHALLV